MHRFGLFLLLLFCSPFDAHRGGVSESARNTLWPMQVLTWPGVCGRCSVFSYQRILMCLQTRCAPYLEPDVTSTIQEDFIYVLNTNKQTHPCLFLCYFVSRLHSRREGGVQVWSAAGNLSRFVLIRKWAAAPFDESLPVNLPLPPLSLTSAPPRPTPTFPDQTVHAKTDKIRSLPE